MSQPTNGSKNHKWRILDSTLREGEQSMLCHFSHDDKIEIVKELSDFGVDIIEMTDPNSSPQSYQDLLEVLDLGLKAKICTSTLCKLDLVKKAAETGVDILVLFIGTSELMQTNSHGKNIDAIIATAKECVGWVKQNTDIEVWFASEDSWTTNFEDLVSVFKAGHEAGANVLCMSDTRGIATPKTVTELVTKLKARLPPSAELDFHGHNDNGCAIANALCAIEAGCTVVETCVLGLGERLGIVPTCGFVACMYTQDRDAMKERFNLKGCKALQQRVAKTAGVEIPFNNIVTGSTAFSHKAGVHVKAVLANPETYEGLNPHDFGIEREIMIAHNLCGWNGIKARSEQLGFSLTKEQCIEAKERIKEMTSASRSTLKATEADRVIEEVANGVAGSNGGVQEAFDLERVLRSNILSMVPYKCARDEQAELGVLLPGRGEKENDYKCDEQVFLDANENVFGCDLPDGILQMDLALERYPCPNQIPLKNEIAAMRGVRADQLTITVGADEVIDLIIRMFCEPNEASLVVTPPTYGMYKVSANINAVEVICSNLTPGFDLDLKDLARKIKPSTKLIFLCSPGNPTTKPIPIGDIRQVLTENPRVMVAVDEAYIDFCDDPAKTTAVSLLDEFPNLMIIQTFSKAFGLAGARCGMLISSTDVATVANQVKAPYNISTLAGEVALHAIKGKDRIAAGIQQCVEERTRVAKELRSSPGVDHVFPSQTNFLLFRLSDVSLIESVYTRMASLGVLVRNRTKDLHCQGCLRVTIGLPAMNNAFLAAFRAAITEATGVAFRGRPLSPPVPEVSFTPVGCVGRYVNGVDLRGKNMRTNPLAPQVVKAIQDGLLEHGLLVFRDQTDMHPEELLALASCFSRPETFDDAKKTLHAGFCEHPEYPCFRQIGTNGGMITNRLGYEWHVDATDVTLLYCLEAPQDHGETLFVELSHLYDALTPEQKQLADLSCALYSTKHTAGGAPAALDWNHGLRMNGTGTKVLRKSVTKKPGYVMKTSPPVPMIGEWNGKKTLRIMSKNLESLGGRSWEESQELVDQLLTAGMKPQKISPMSEDFQFNEYTEFGPDVLQYKWKSGDICLWSNSAVLHSTSPPDLYKGQVRRMWQTQICCELVDHEPSFGAYANNTTLEAKPKDENQE
eukprot:CAMPEP_0172395570 /NCGR_PEP_ID=MMETSP1061-20121228/20522_1 /TAXON_ID=37318 /ORGANISM="Pseudo-nitzschia pungens, Strain cf. pungens" /LENGTH=1138 /DNA_ID=CAMNT_0013127199 /DNA_START=89 /DNA_END=3505 /DNA_ORIENTATION=+